MVAIGADHGGYILKEGLIKSFEGEIEFKDFGTVITCELPTFLILTVIILLLSVYL